MGLLSAQERADVEAHLAGCAWGQHQLATYDVPDAAVRRRFAGETVATPVAAPRTGLTLTLEEIMQASSQRPATTPPPAPSLVRPRNPRLSMLATVLATVLGTVAAVLVLTVLVASLYAYFGSRGSAPASHRTPASLPAFDLGGRLLATAILDASALLIAVLICVALGLFARSRPRAATAAIEAIRSLSLMLPTIVLGPLLIFIFVVHLHLFPVGATTRQLFDVGRLFLPALTLAIGAVALTLAQVRPRAFSFARADRSGVGSWAVIGLHLLGATISGTLVVEIIFTWPGIGYGAFGYGIFLYDRPHLDLGILGSIVLVTSAFYLVVALAAGAAARVLGQRGALTRPEPNAPEEAPASRQGAERNLPRWAALTLLGTGTALVAAVVLATIFAPLLTHSDPGFIDLSVANGPPSAAHPLGTDDLGRDILSQLLYAGRVSLAIGALAVVWAAVSGLALGALLGRIPAARRRIGALVDGALTALTAFPTLFVALGLVDLLHPSFTSLVEAFAISQVPTFARLGLTLMRGRGRDTADRSPVAQRRSTPEAIGRLLAQASSSMAIVLVGVSALTFLFGGEFLLTLPPFLRLQSNAPLFDWGALIGAHGVVPFAPAWYPPSLDAARALGICVLGFTLVGQGLRSLLDRRDIRSHQQAAPPSSAVGERMVTPLG